MNEFEWTPPQMLFVGYRVLQLFCHNEKGAHDAKCGQILARTDIFLISETWF